MVKQRMVGWFRGKDLAFFIYLMARVIAAIAGVILLKYLVTYLNKGDYGSWGYMKVVGLALIPVVSLSLPAAMMRMFFDRAKDDHAGQASLITTAFMLSIIGAIVLCVIGLIVMGLGDSDLGFYILFAVSGHTMLRFFDYLARTRNNYFVFFFNRMVEATGFLAFMIVLTGDTPDEGGTLFHDSHLLSTASAYGICIWTVVLTNVAFYVKARYLTWSIRWLSRAEIKALLKFSIPLSGTYFIGWLLSSSDIYILQKLSTGSEVGNYVFAVEIATFVSLITQSALTDWPRFFYALMRDDPADKDARIASRMRLFLGLHIGALLVIRLIARLAYDLFDAEAYLDGVEFVNYLVLGNYFFLLGNLFGVTIAHAKETHLTFLSFAIPGGLNIGLNLWLIPEHGARAAAITTLVSFVAFAIITYAYSARFYRFQQVSRVLAYSGVATAAALIPLPFG